MAGIYVKMPDGREFNIVNTFLGRLKCSINHPEENPFHDVFNFNDGDIIRFLNDAFKTKYNIYEHASDIGTPESNKRTN